MKNSNVTIKHNIAMFITLFLALIPAAGYFTKQQVTSLEFAFGNIPVVLFGAWVLVETGFHIRTLLKSYKEHIGDDNYCVFEDVYHSEKSCWICTLVATFICLFAYIFTGAMFGDNALVCMYTLALYASETMAWYMLRFIVYLVFRAVTSMYERIREKE